MPSTFVCLPNEILQMVFEHLNYKTSVIKECIRVCKGSKQLYQTMLYSGVVLHDYSQLAKFVNTLEKSKYLSSLVKKLKFKFRINFRGRLRNFNVVKVFNLLPNLESLDCSVGAQYFTFLSEALLANQLPKLNYLEPPKAQVETGNYTTCAILVKDRLRNLELVNKFSGVEDSNHEYTDNRDIGEEDSEEVEERYNKRKKYFLQFHRLFDRLNQFKNLHKLCIKMEVDKGTEFIEHISNTCPNLRYLGLYGRIADDNTGDINGETISKLSPARAISELNLITLQLQNPLLLQYIAHKFPNLKKLQLTGTSDAVLDKNSLTNFLNYLAKIKNIEMKCIPYDDQRQFHCWEKIIVRLRVLAVDNVCTSTTTEIDMDINEESGKLTIKPKQLLCMSLQDMP